MIDNDFATESRIEETPTVDITVGETSGVSVGTRVVVNHNASGLNQHTIGAITGLRTELDEIEKLKPVYSNKFGTANYYKCSDGPYDSYGYFVTLATADTVKKCNAYVNDDIFGVTVRDAAFIGGQDEGTILKPIVDDNMVLVATTGLVTVRCESDVVTGDYIISNAYGVACKTDSEKGYRVCATHTDISTDFTYASIMLGVQADMTDKIATSVKDLDTRLDACETQIIAAANLAQSALNKANDIDSSSLVTSGKLESLEDAIGTLTSSQDSMTSEIVNATTIAQAAKTAAENAVAEAETMRIQAIDEVNKAVEETTSLRSEFSNLDEQITDVDDKVSIVTKTINAQYEVVESWDKANKSNTSVIYYVEDEKKYYFYENNTWKSTTDAARAGLPVAVAGIQVKTDANSSNINSLTTWQGTTNAAMTRIEQKADANGAYIQSTVSNMDRYTVGPYSQAYGFTREQAGNILEEGMIYVPTEDKTSENGKAESYYIDAEQNKQTYTQEFYREFLYRWSKISNQYYWIPVDKNYNETTINTSNKTVWFVDKKPTTTDTTHGYWYKTGIAKNVSGEVIEAEYAPHTLYKWALSYKYKDGETDKEKYEWFAVATLAGNSKNRAVSQIRQDADKIAASITNVKGDYASIQAQLTETNASITALADWKNGQDTNKAIIRQESDDNGARIVIAALTEENGETKDMASLVLNVNQQDGKSALVLDADNIVIDGNTTFKGKVAEIANNSINNSYIEYALSTSSDNFVAVEGSDGEWSIAAPTWRDDTYMWQRAVLVKADGTTIPSTPVCIQGAKGANGAGLAIKGTAYIKDITMNDDIIGEKYVLYSDKACTTQIITATDGDAYLVDGYLFVYSDDNKFTCSGKIQGVGVTGVITRYYISSSDVAPDNDSAGWYNNFDDMLDKYWELKDANSGTTYYIWSQEMVSYSSGNPSYSTPTKNGANSFITLCCQQNNETKINGAHIATGTINASDITTGKLDAGIVDADTLSAITANLGEITAGTIESQNYTVDGGKCTSGMKLSLNDATWDSKNFTIDADGDVTMTGTVIATEGGSIGGWDIGPDGILKNNMGLSSGTASYTSLTSEERSPVRIFAGGLLSEAIDNKVQIEKVNLGSLMSKQTVTKTFNLSPSDTTKYIIKDAKCLTAKKTWDGSKEETVSITSGSWGHNGEKYAYTITLPSIYPSWARVTNVTYSGSVDYIEYSDFHNGTLSVDFFSSMNTSITGVVTCSYTYTETLDVLVSHDESSYTVVLTPKVSVSTTHPLTYDNLEISLTLDGKKPKFTVLEDGSLYASAVDLTGKINAQRGNIGGLVIDNGIKGYQGGVESFSLTADGLMINNSESRLRVGNFETYYNPGDANTYWQTYGPLYIQGIQSGTTISSIEMMTDVGTAYQSATLSLEIKRFEDAWHTGAYARLKTSNTSLYSPVVCTVYYRGGQSRDIDSAIIRTMTFKIKPGDTYSQMIALSGFGGLIGFGDIYVQFGRNSSDVLNSTKFRMRAYADWTQIWNADYITQKQSKNNILIQGNILPKLNNTYDLGTSSFQWKSLHSEFGNFGILYSKSGKVDGSDRNKKNTINTLSSNYELLFDKLRPVTFKYNDGTSDRLHTGFIAQEVRDSVIESGLTTKEFAGYCEWKDDNDVLTCGLRYSEFISLCVHEIQKLKQRTLELEAKIDELTKQND